MAFDHGGVKGALNLPAKLEDSDHSKNSVCPKPITNNLFSTLALIRSLHKATKSLLHNEYFPCSERQKSNYASVFFSRVFRGVILSSCTDTYSAVAKPS